MKAAHHALRLFGKPQVISSGVMLHGMPKKAFLLAAVVALAPDGECLREKAAENLWPDLASAQRSNNLRQLLHRIRAFETRNDFELLGRADEVLRLGGSLRCDVDDLIAIDTNGHSTPDPQVLLDCYSGRLLDDVRVSPGRISRWLEEWRLQLEDQFVDAMTASLTHCAPDDRKSFLDAAISRAPNSIALRKALLQVLIADGDTQAARRQYRIMRHVVGHGAVAAPAELSVDAAPRIRSSQVREPSSVAGREQAGVPRLALLPPKSGGDQDRYLVDGLIDDVTVALTRLRTVSVIAPHTARQVAKGEDNLGIGISRADYVLRTKLPRPSSAPLNGPVMLTLVLERFSTGEIVWSDRIPLFAHAGPLEFAIVANAVAMVLVDQIERSTLRLFQVPADAGAYGHYLIGQKSLQALDLPSIRRARASFKTALSSAPDFAPAHAAYSQTLVYEWVTRGKGDRELIEDAEAAAERARQLDPLFGGAHQMLGRCSLFSGDFDTSLEHFSRAESLTPHHADLLCDFADTLMHNSQSVQANEKIELALRLNPLAPDAYWWASAGIKFSNGLYEDALQHLARVTNDQPVLRLIAACAAMAGDADLARRCRNRFMQLDPGFRLDDWITVLPLKDPSHRRHYRQALQKAGFK